MNELIEEMMLTPGAEISGLLRQSAEPCLCAALLCGCGKGAKNTVAITDCEIYVQVSAVSGKELSFTVINGMGMPGGDMRGGEMTPPEGEIPGEDFGGEIPEDIDSLMKLPGVGRKTANVVSSIIYSKPVIAVDTHVFRVARRLGLSSGKTPYAVEKDLEKGFPPELRPKAHHWLILHGRYVCTAKSPKCTECGLSDWCKEYCSTSR